jgi:DNA-binding NarL/FixJ family response regulator
VLVVGEHRAFAEAMAQAIGREDGLSARAAGSEDDLIAIVSEMQPALAFVEVPAPGQTGIDAIRRVRVARPGTTIVALSPQQDELFMARIVEAGATGLLSPSASLDEVVVALRRSSTGERLMEQTESNRLMRILRRQRHQEATERQRAGRLTRRQTQILQLMADGLSGKEIARRIGVSYSTLRTHIQNILTRLGVHTKVEALAVAIRHGKVSAG